MFRKLLCSLLITLACSPTALAAEDLKVAYGKLSLIDLGSLLMNDVTVLDDSLVRVYTLSGLKEEEKKSVIAIQGLKSKGETDLTARTAAGIFQFHLILGNSREDLIMDPDNSRTKILDNKFPISLGRLSLVSCPSHINEYVLAGNPNLIELRQVVTDNDPEFLKTFALASKNVRGRTDIVIASKSGVYKFELDIGSKEHSENISLYAR